MIVCSCNVLSDRQIRSAVTETQAPVRTVGQVYRCLGCSAQCGRCARTIRKLLDDVNASACSACPLECPVSAQAPGQPAHLHGENGQAAHAHAAHTHAAHTHATHSHAARPHGENTHAHGRHAHGEHAHGEHAHGEHAHSRPSRSLGLAVAAE
ncbi:(2Fe-2S)-binding protein [Ancylobacter sp.]|uniref:(2Fe-2S)-binding protein n=1 Tax=Ancylobacter sp. TaxID=1872567 RepID=UPI003D10E31C